MNKEKTIFVAGHKGMVGSAICRELIKSGYSNILVEDRNKLDLMDRSAVLDFLDSNKIDKIIIAAAKVGGINANNSLPADFIYENLMIELNLINGAHLVNIKDVLFLGSSCIYPKDCPQPMSEDLLLSGVLEPTNEPYAIAKIAGIKLCESFNRQYGYNYRSIMPTNLYGPGDNFNLNNSHVIPGLIRKFHDAHTNNEPKVIVWGTGEPKREFLHVDDLAKASIFIMNLETEKYKSAISSRNSHINIGYGEEISIKDLAFKIKEIVGFEGEIEWDSSKPDGAKRKLMDNSLINGLGWNPSIDLNDGIKRTYEWFKTNKEKLRL